MVLGVDIKISRSLAFVLSLILSTLVTAQTGSDVLDKARELKRSKKYEEATELFKQYFENPVQPGHGGVRTSFALGDWIELGKLYPPALQIIKESQNSRLSLIDSDKATRQDIRDFIRFSEALDPTFDHIEDFYFQIPDEKPGKLFVKFVLFEDLAKRNLYKEALEPAIEFALRRNVILENVDELFRNNNYGSQCIGHFGPHGTVTENRDILVLVVEVLTNNEEEVLAESTQKIINKIDQHEQKCIDNTI